jgi:iron complex transport system permease protein
MPTVAVAAASARPTRLRAPWLVAGLVAVAAAVVLGLTVGPVAIRPWAVIEELASHLPFLHVRSGLSAPQAAIIMELRLPRVVLALLVGAMLAMAGTAYQGVFRNPLADPYLLGAAAGAGLGVTIVFITRSGGLGGSDPLIPVAAFVGALGAVALAFAVGRSGGRSSATLLLAGVAIMSFLTAIQTYLQQQHAETLREVYTWILGRLTTAGWSDVLLVLPYFAVTTAVLLAHRRVLDVLAVGEAEAGTLGIPIARTRLIIIATASLATAAAVAVSGLIGFVGIIVPHMIRLVAGTSYRVVLPLSILFGGAFLALADLAARTVTAPSEIPIGVVTAFVGAPFFVLALRTTQTARQ